MSEFEYEMFEENWNESEELNDEQMTVEEIKDRTKAGMYDYKITNGFTTEIENHEQSEKLNVA